ncbi:MAG: SpoIIE family protein phosphatase [Acidimicrobiia bacterium]
MPDTPQPGAPGRYRWQLAPGSRDLGRVWVTVVFAGLTVAGVLVVAVLGIRNGQATVEGAERTEIAVEMTLLMRSTVLALQDERGIAEMWLTDPTPEVRVDYTTSQATSDSALESLRSAWQRHRVVIDAVGPPTLADVDDSVATLELLRDGAMHLREDSTVDSYSGVTNVLISAIRRVERLAEQSTVGTGIRSLVQVIEAGEALGRQRDVVTALLVGEDEISQDELVRLLLLQQEAQTNLSSIRSVGVQDTGIRMSEFLAAMNSGEVQEILEMLDAGENDIDPWRWFDAASDRLDTLRLIGSSVQGDLESAARDLRGSAETTAAVRTVGLSALLVVSVLAGAAAIGVARERAKALAEHGDLARGLYEWFEPERLVPVPGLRLAGRYDAASEFTRAGGDWYDVYRIPDGRVALTVGDVAGHGAAATAQMAQTRNLLRGMTLAASERSPALQMIDLDVALRDTGTMATIFHGLVDVEGGEFVYTRAGHLPGIAIHGESAAWLDDALGPPVGADSEEGYTEVSIRLEVPWHLLLFTDGLVEARDIDLEAALEALKRKVAESSDSLASLADSLIDTRASRLDDAALLVVSSEDRSHDPGGEAVPPR